MSGTRTQSDVFGAGGTAAALRAVHALVVVMNGDDLTMPPSRHVLDGIDVVSFSRGPRAFVRDEVDGLARLRIQIPDPMMSADHGRLFRSQGRWMIDDPRSKNGVVIAGHASRTGTVEPGDLFELGRTLFLLETLALPVDVPGDAMLDDSSVLASLHPELIAAREVIGLVARSDVPILIVGDTGTGKEVYAQAVHAASGRSGPLVALNCGALSASLLEAELFGHRSGAFPGATADRPGFVRSADGGTLFLDEVSELSPAGQVALLRVLEERAVIPVGDSQPVRVDVRLCVATQRMLQLEVDAGRFRSDLYARLLGYELRLPSLRERPFDIGALVARLVARLAPNRRGAITPAAVRALVSYEWPRNIRELERCLATALVLSRDRPIDLEHLPEVVRQATSGRVRPMTRAATRVDIPQADDADATLREQLAAKLVEHRGNVSAVARDFGKHREQVQRWLRRFGFDPEAFRR